MSKFQGAVFHIIQVCFATFGLVVLAILGAELFFTGNMQGYIESTELVRVANPTKEYDAVVLIKMNSESDEIVLSTYVVNCAKRVESNDSEITSCVIYGGGLDLPLVERLPLCVNWQSDYCLLIPTNNIRRSSYLGLFDVPKPFTPLSSRKVKVKLLYNCVGHFGNTPQGHFTPEGINVIDKGTKVHWFELMGTMGYYTVTFQFSTMDKNEAYDSLSIRFFDIVRNVEIARSAHRINQNGNFLNGRDCFVKQKIVLNKTVSKESMKVRAEVWIEARTGKVTSIQLFEKESLLLDQSKRQNNGTYLQ